MRFPGDGRHFATAVKAWFRRLKKNSRIAILVGLAHIGAILWMGIDHCLSDRPKIRRPVIVRTIRPPAAPIRIAPSQKPEAAPAAPFTAARERPAALPKAPTVAREQSGAAAAKTKKRATASTRPGSKPAGASSRPQTIPDETVRQIEEEFNALASGQTTRRTAPAEIRLPGVLQSRAALNASIEEDIAQASVPSTYHLCLVNLLQSSLQLPELGDVRVKIVLSAPGTLSSVQILDTRSEKNAQWLRNQLPLLSLPCFNDFGIVDATLELTITFRNVEN